MSRRLPPQWRERFVDMVRGAAPLDGEWFTGGPWMSPVAQIGVYREQYALRLTEAVREEAPGTRWMLGESADDAFRAYLADHPSTSWTLNRVAVALADWLERSGHPPEVVEMARLDRAVQAGFEAGDGEPLRPEALATVTHLALQRHVSLLHVGHNVHQLRSAIVGGTEIPPLRPADVHLVVFRRGLRMRHWELDPTAWHLLAELDRGATLDRAIESACARAWVDLDELPGRLQGWFRDFAERDLVRAGSRPAVDPW